jgi:predicted amidohydrolase YtcJ
VADQGWQFAVHANGDAAIEATLDVYREVLGGRSGLAHRHRIEHCTLVHPAQLKAMAQMGLSPSFLIGHVYYWGQAFREHILGPERAKQIDPCLSALRAGLRISMHSDFNVTTIAPLRYISNAVTRSLYFDDGNVLNAAERLSVDQAIRAVTLDAAWQCHVDNLVGSLEVGKRADFVILSNDPAAVHPERIQHLQVRETWLDGVPQLRG